MKRTSVFQLLSGLLPVWTLLLFGCGEQFATEIPDEYDPDNKPSIQSIGLKSKYEMFVGDKVVFDADNFKFSNGMSFGRQGTLNQEYLMNSLFWATEHGDTIVQIRTALGGWKGTYTLTAMTPGEDHVKVLQQDGKQFGQCTVTVLDKNATPTSISYDRALVVLTEGDVYTPTVKCEPDYTEYDDFAWRSTNTDVVTVDDDGTFRAVGEGAAMVYVSIVDDPTVKTFVTVVVLPDWETMWFGWWPEETVIYADIFVDGKRPDPYLTSIAARLIDDYRAVGRAVYYNGINYYVFRVAGTPEEIAYEYPITFLGIDMKRHTYIDFWDTQLTFDGKVQGTLSNLIRIEGETRDPD